MTMMLKPCPFCGGPADIHYEVRAGFCLKCEARGPITDGGTLIAELWNNRPLPPPLTGPSYAHDYHHLATEAANEAIAAASIHRPLNSVHEAYAVILEELDEAWEIVKRKHHRRDYYQLRRELIQTAAMCLRAIHDTIGTLPEKPADQHPTHQEL